MQTTEQTSPSELERLAMDAEARIPFALTQEERDYWTRMAAEWWQAVCDAEDND